MSAMASHGLLSRCTSIKGVKDGVKGTDEVALLSHDLQFYPHPDRNTPSPQEDIFLFLKGN